MSREEQPPGRPPPEWEPAFDAANRALQALAELEVLIQERGLPTREIAGIQEKLRAMTRWMRRQHWRPPGR